MAAAGTDVALAFIVLVTAERKILMAFLKWIKNARIFCVRMCAVCVCVCACVYVCVCVCMSVCVCV